MAVIQNACASQRLLPSGAACRQRRERIAELSQAHDDALKEIP